MLINKYKYNCATVLLKNKQGSEYCFRVINKYNNPVNKTCNSRMMGLLSLSNVIRLCEKMFHESTVIRVIR